MLEYWNLSKIFKIICMSDYSRYNIELKVKCITIESDDWNVEVGCVHKSLSDFFLSKQDCIYIVEKVNSKS